MDTLAAHDWPGNVRELINALKQTILANRDAPTLYPAHLPRAIRLNYVQAYLHEKRNGSPGDTPDAPALQADGISIPIRFTDPPLPLKQLRDQVTEQLERAYLKHLMAYGQNDLDLVGKCSGLSKPRIYALLKKYDIPKS
jgi:two-component system NtrC family response regulator